MAEFNTLKFTAMEEAAPDLYAALKTIMGLLDEGILVRDTSHDFEQGWHLKALPIVMALKDAQNALAKAEGRQ